MGLYDRPIVKRKPALGALGDTQVDPATVQQVIASSTHPSAAQEAPQEAAPASAIGVAEDPVRTAAPVPVPVPAEDGEKRPRRKPTRDMTPVPLQVQVPAYFDAALRGRLKRGTTMRQLVLRALSEAYDIPLDESVLEDGRRKRGKNAE